jgi:CPA1 family monovalent cation:H+ antiporter
VFVVSWAGMRGAISLAAALALPLAPTPFPQRDLVIFLTFCVIVATLVGQGLTLPFVVRTLGVLEMTGPDAEEGRARLAATEAALHRLTELEVEYPTHKPLIDNLRERYEHEASHQGPEGDGPRDEEELELLEHKEIRDAVLDAEREAVIRMRDEGVIGDEALVRVQRDLDLESLREGA